MTFKQFLVELKTCELDWQILGGDGGAIRSWRLDNKCPSVHCPISAVTGNHNHFARPKAGGGKLGLRPNVTNCIVKASDDRPNRNSITRELLLDACGLPTEA